MKVIYFLCVIVNPKNSSGNLVTNIDVTYSYYILTRCLVVGYVTCVRIECITAAVLRGPCDAADDVHRPSSASGRGGGTILPPTTAATSTPRRSTGDLACFSLVL